MLSHPSLVMCKSCGALSIEYDFSKTIQHKKFEDSGRKTRKQNLHLQPAKSSRQTNKRV